MDGGMELFLLHNDVHQSKVSEVVNATKLGSITALCVGMFCLIGVGWASYIRVSNKASEAQSQYLANVRIALLCASWAATSIGMSVLNKGLVEILHAPALISGFQMAVTALAVGAYSGQSLLEVNRAQLSRWLVVPLFFAAILVSSFYTFEYISLTMLTVTRNLAPIIVIPIERIVMPRGQGPDITPGMGFALILMLLGATVYAGVVSCSKLGLSFAMANMLLAVSDRLIQRRLLTNECKDLRSSQCTILNNSLGMVPTLLIGVFSHQFTVAAQPAQAANWTDPRVMFTLLLSSFVGLGICYLGFECQREISATSFFVLQNASKVAVVTAGVMVFGDRIDSATSAVGLLLSLSGSLLYGKMQVDLKAQQSEKQALLRKDNA